VPGSQTFAPVTTTPTITIGLGQAVAAGRGRRGICAPGGTVQGRHLEGRKYGIMKMPGELEADASDRKRQSE